MTLLAEHISERKHISILFADIQQSTHLVADMEPEQALEFLEPALNVMRTAVRRHGGIVSKELGDGIKSLFGAPVSTPWHAVMACRAALDILQGIAQLGNAGLQVRCGVHSHYVVTTTTRGDHSQVYDATGPAAHLANRLEAAARAGEAIVSESCRALCGDLFVFEALPPAQLKGFANPVPIHRLVAQKPLSLWHARAANSIAPFSGRRAELEKLQRVARTLPPHRFRTVAVAGEAGIGKSRLAQEFLNTIPDGEWRLVQIDCPPTAMPNSYGAAAAILAQLGLGPSGPLRAPPPADASPADALGTAMSDYWPSAMATIFDRPVEDRGWVRLEAEYRSRVIQEAFLHILHDAASDRPLMIFVDDIQWMDPQSAAVLKQAALARPACGALLLATLRSDQGAPSPDIRYDEVVALGPMSADATAEILDAVLGSAPLLDRIKSRIARHTGGVPLFIEEVVRHLAQANILEGEGGGHELLEAFNTLKLPPTVEGTIAERLDRLDVPLKRLAQVAAVVGTDIDPGLLALAAGRPPPDVASDLAALEARGFLVPVMQNDGPRFEFGHDLIREVAYRSLLAREREDIHRQILRELEAADDPPQAELLLRHAQGAQQWDGIARYGSAAARRSFQRSVLYDAARYYELAVGAADRLQDERDFLLQSIDLRLEARLSLASLGRVQLWRSFAEEAFARASAITDEPRMLAAVVERASAANFALDPPEAIRFGRSAVAASRRTGSRYWQHRASYALAQAYMNAGHYRNSVRHLRLATANLDPGAYDPNARPIYLRNAVVSHMMLAIGLASLGMAAGAAEAQGQAETFAGLSGQPYERIVAGYGRGFVALEEGKVDEAALSFRESYDLAATYDVRQFSAVISAQLGRTCILAGEWADALRILANTEAEAKRAGHALPAMQAAVHRALALAASGDPSAALADLRATQGGCRRRGFLGVLAEALVAEARILVASGHGTGPGTDAILSEAAALARRIGARSLLAACDTLRRHPGAAGSAPRCVPVGIARDQMIPRFFRLS